MHLTIQGLRQILTTDLTLIKHVASLTQAEKMIAITPQAVRLENLRCGKEAAIQLKAQIEADCLAAHLDITLSESPRTLADFKLVAMDMDSTLITIECIDEIADMQGLKPQVSAITEAAMRGEIEFQESLARRVALLKGLDAAALQKVYEERVRLSPGAENMLKAVQQAGLKTLLVSGGFTFFTDRMKTRCNLDYTHANVLEIEQGKLTGKVVGGIVDALEKQRTVERVAAELGIATKQVIVMGDGANDLKMMGISGLSVAFRAKPVVRAQADVALNFVGLDGVLNVLHP
ncbi:phosphoserine phosphatase SerB [Undibacterium sp. Jales W-56]|uniref:phosphoserine phosphatase SerB n=1 Tax=Undibacterium sp. Jales W-56 TaxID=2897325 RepID=UPI0021D311D0|nr:phosphoserine phosphatase SerB [Undibacterium sp. Jales W-56]MCU6433667.1 phosphoserine phosphatase SerB [Undibacterium sp. Jales W-56]